MTKSVSKIANEGGAMWLDAACDGPLLAVRSGEPEALTRVLRRGILVVSRPVLLEKVIPPLLRAVGDGWESGDSRSAE